MAVGLDAGEEFLLLACDGLWDVLDADQVVAFVANHLEEGKDTSEVCICRLLINVVCAIPIMMALFGNC